MLNVIAIDGPAASGKGTLARRLAAHLGWAYLDTGKIYRAVALRMVQHLRDMGGAADSAPDPELATQMAESLDPAELANPALLGDEVAQMASKVAAIAGVRAALLAFQRQFAAQPPAGLAGAILDGRDIGTVVCPEAPHKLFVTASDAVRAERRYKELQARGESSIYARVLEDLQQRDARDKERAIAPLKPADGAQVIDTSMMDADQAFAAALAALGLHQA